MNSVPYCIVCLLCSNTQEKKNERKKENERAYSNNNDTEFTFLSYSMVKWNQQVFCLWPNIWMCNDAPMTSGKIMRCKRNGLKKFCACLCRQQSSKYAQWCFRFALIMLIFSRSLSPPIMVYDAHMPMSRYSWLIVCCVHEIETLGVTKAFHKHWQ